MKNIFFEINFFLFLEILFFKQNVYLISDNNNFYINILKKVCKKKFHVISIYTSNIKIKNENIHFVSEKLAKKYTNDITNKILKSKIFKIEKFSNFFFEIKHIISKYLYDDLILLILKIETTNHTLKGKKIFNLNNIDRGVVNYLDKVYPFKVICNSYLEKHINFCLLILKSFIFNFVKKLFYIIHKKKFFLSKNFYSSILVNTENNISFDNSRNDFFYLKKKKQENNFENKN